MTTCLKYCVPLSAICFIGALTWQALGLPFLNDIAPVAGAGKPAVRESWWLEKQRLETQLLKSADEDVATAQFMGGPAEGGVQ
jgi:NADH-quinone oxidoreductase subunit H